MTNLIIALLLLAVGVIISIYGTSLNSNLIHVDYLIVVPFIYYLALSIFPRLAHKNITTSLGGILMCTVIYVFIHYWGNMSMITPALTTTIISTLITYVALRLVYRRD